MLVGEAPGADEERTGRPFIGRSGIRLNALLALAGIDRDSVYVTNVVKHRPPRHNPKPLKAEIGGGKLWLDAEVAAVNPNIILALGAVATKALTGVKVNMVKDHGMPLAVGGRIIVPLYHPAASFHNPNLLPVIYDDFLRLRDRLAAVADLEPHYRLGTGQEAAAGAWASGAIGFDFETTSPKRGRWFAADEAEIVGYSVSWSPLHGLYIDGLPGPEMVQVLESPDIVKVCHNSKFEYGRLRAVGVELRNFHDTKIAANLLQHPSSELKALARQVLGTDPPTYEQTTGGRDMSELSPEEVVDYAVGDADNTLRLWGRLHKSLHDTELYAIYSDTELPLVPVIADMEQWGVGVDVVRATEVEAEIGQRIDAVDAALRNLLPLVDNTNSPNQIAKALEDMGAPITARTPVTKRMVVDDETLESLVGWNEGLVEALLLSRRLRKMKSYVHNFIALRGKDGRLHPSIHQAGGYEEAGRHGREAPVTGRLSCSAPNMQNIPHRGDVELVKAIRDCIIPSTGKLLLSADVSQEEARILAFVAQEPQMLEDFASGHPVYSFVGEALYDRPINKKDNPHEWFVAKTVFLALMYGCDTEKLLSIDPTMSWKQASLGSRRLQRRYKRINTYRIGVEAEVYETGEVRDWFGRRRMLPGTGGDIRQRQEAFREGFNMTVQGPAATVMKQAMRRVWDRLPEGAHLLMSIHDELVFECGPRDLDAVAEICYNAFQNIMPIAFPLEFNVGERWGSLRPFTPKVASL